VIAVPEKKKPKSPKKDKGKEKGKDKSSEKKDSKKKTTKGGKGKKKEEKSAKYAKQVDQLLEMGFGQSVAELALEKTSGDVVRNTATHSAHAHTTAHPVSASFAGLRERSAVRPRCAARTGAPGPERRRPHRTAHSPLTPQTHVYLFTVTCPHRTSTRRRCSTPASRACPRRRWRALRTSSVSLAPPQSTKWLTTAIY
jgi:hypothetical protein